MISKKIFISPLDWGLGHTTRCIPIAKELHKQGHELYFGVNKLQKHILEQELNFGEYIDFEGYNISYPKGGNMAIKMLLESPKILRRIREENKELHYLIDLYNFDIVISDNRFGLHTKKIPCIYITHQINIQGPLLIKKQLHQIHGNYINKFTSCWIPDIEGENNLAGELSHGNLHKNCSYIGPLSRFTHKATTISEDIDYLAIISGPEPQRSEFEKIIVNKFHLSDKKCAILGGTPLNPKSKHIKNIEYYPHLNSHELYELVNRSKKIICRPGYSSIMDFSILQKPVHFIPTPGQTEQEYLAKYLTHNKGWSSQNKLNLSQDLQFNKLPFSRSLLEELKL